MKTLTKAIAIIGALPIAGIIALTGAGSAFATACPSGQTPTTINNTQVCIPNSDGGTAGGGSVSVGGGASTVPGQAGGIVSGGGYKPPAYHAPSASPVSTPATTVFIDSVSLQYVAHWSAPKNVVGTVAGYTVILKQTGKADRTFTTKSTRISFGTAGGGLAENASYVAQVKANIVSKSGVKSTSPTASVSFNTRYAPTTVKASAPRLRITDVGANAFTVRWAAPTGAIGSVVNYSVKLKRGDVVVAKFNVSPSTYAYRTPGLSTRSSYTVEITANFVSANGANKASATSKTPPTLPRFRLS